MHDVIVVGVPLLAILAGILFNRNDIKDLRTEMNGLRVEMNVRFNQIDGNVADRFNKLDGSVGDRFNKVDARFNKVDDRFDRIESSLTAIEADLRQFYHFTGKLEGRVDAIEKRF